MSDFTIRLAGENDGHALATMIDRMDSSYGDPPRPPEETRSATDRWLRQARSSTQFVLVFRQSEPVGFASFAVLYPGTDLRGQLFLKDLFVDENWRGRKIGHDVMKFLAQYCLREQIGRIDWFVENERSQRFYDRVGAMTLPAKRLMRIDGEALINLADAG